MGDAVVVVSEADLKALKDDDYITNFSIPLSLLLRKFYGF